MVCSPAGASCLAGVATEQAAARVAEGRAMGRVVAGWAVAAKGWEAGVKGRVGTAPAAVGRGLGEAGMVQKATARVVAGMGWAVKGLVAEERARAAGAGAAGTQGGTEGVGMEAVGRRLAWVEGVRSRVAAGMAKPLAAAGRARVAGVRARVAVATAGPLVAAERAGVAAGRARVAVGWARAVGTLVAEGGVACRGRRVAKLACEHVLGCRVFRGSRQRSWNLWGDSRSGRGGRG